MRGSWSRSSGSNRRRTSRRSSSSSTRTRNTLNPTPLKTFWLVSLGMWDAVLSGPLDHAAATIFDKIDTNYYRGVKNF